MFNDRDGDGASFWFDGEVFSNPSFDAKVYVDDLRRYVPLETLRSRLEQHAEALRNRLIEVVNEDYDDFVSLSTKLVDVDGATAKLQAPLNTVRAQIQHTKAEVLRQIAALEELQARKQAAASTRILLEVAQEALQGMAKVEHLVQELVQDRTANHHTGQILLNKSENMEALHDSLENRARLLDRLCSEISKLHYVVRRGEAVPLVRSLSSPRLEKASMVVYESLDSVLSDVLRAQNPSALSLLLHAYATLDRGSVAEGVVRTRVIAPIIAPNCFSANVFPSGSSSSSSSSIERERVEYVDALSKIKKALDEEAGQFLRAVMSTTSNMGGDDSHRVSFDFLGASVLPEVLKTLDALGCSGPSTYSPGKPQQFHRNYLAAIDFLSSLEELCHTKAQVERFRASQAYAEWMRNWNLTVYFSLCYQEVAGALEEALDAGLVELPVSTQEDEKSNMKSYNYIYSFSNATEIALMKCVDGTMYVYALSDKFLRLGLQVVSRFAAWVRHIEPDGQGKDEDEGQQGQGQGHGDGQQGSTTKGSTTEYTVEALIALWSDVQAIETDVVQARFFPTMRKLMERVNDGLLPETQQSTLSRALTEACDDASGVLKESSDLVLHRIADIVADECCESLQHVRGIVATFRMTARSAPTRPAQYASTLTVPISNLISSGRKTKRYWLSDEAIKKVVVSIADRVALRYATLVAETLSTVRKTESSLRRLKSRKEGVSSLSTASGTAGDQGSGGGSASGGSLGTADELIAQQFELDIGEFESRIVDMGVDVNGLESFTALRTALVTNSSDG